MIPQTVLIALTTLASEDLACIGAGVLIARGDIGFAEGTMACFAGIFAGDLLLVAGGRLAGRRLSGWPWARRFVDPGRVERAAVWLEARGPFVAFLSRFTPGLRLPTYLAAGFLRINLLKFSAYLFAACAVWTPLLVGATVVVGDELLRPVFDEQSRSTPGLLAAVALLLAASGAIRGLMHPAGLRRLMGRWMRLRRWEFWPPWAAYLPLAPYLAYLAVRHGSLTAVLSANPGIRRGGLTGESKSEILRHLSRVEDAVPAFALIPARLAARERIEAALTFLGGGGRRYPVVLKPDVGERGSGVAIVRTDAEVEAYLGAARGDTIIQRYVEGMEFGVFYYRYPGEQRGHVMSITEKCFPSLTGDGRASLSELILRDARAVCLADTYEKAARLPLDYVPAAGEEVRLVEIGSHCRGAVFLNASHLATPALEEAIDRLARAHPGFYFGRFDLRVRSHEALRRGQGIRVIELNGVSAEAAHIYDPAVSVWEAYRVLFRQWRIAFEIGSANRRSRAAGEGKLIAVQNEDRR